MSTKAVANRVPTGTPGLDQIIGGGLPPEKLYLIQGPPGSGKTTLALQFLLEGVKRGESVLYLTLSETKAELQAIALSHGWDISGIHIHEVQTHPRELIQDDQYSVFHASEVELGEVMKELLDVADKIKPTRAVVDSLSEMRLLARDALRYRRQMLVIKDYFTSRGCTVILLDAMVGAGDDLQSNTLPHGVILLDALYPNYGVRRRRMSIVKLRGVKFDDGFHDFRIETGGVKVYPRLVASDHALAGREQNAPSGIEGLDSLTGGGLTRGTSTAILGSAGVGKSTLASQYALAAVGRGEVAAVFLFDETSEVYTQRSEGFGMPFSDAIKTKRVFLQQVYPGELAPGQFVDHVRRCVEESGARVVIIDSLNGYLQATPDERFLLVQLHELLSYLSRRGVVTILIVAQHGMLGNGMNAAIDVSYLSDTVFLLRYFEYAGEVRKCISVVKKRTGRHELTIRELKLGKGGVTVGEPLSRFHGVLTGVPTYEQSERLPGGGENGGRDA